MGMPPKTVNNMTILAPDSWQTFYCPFKQDANKFAIRLPAGDFITVDKNGKRLTGSPSAEYTLNCPMKCLTCGAEATVRRFQTVDMS